MEKLRQLIATISRLKVVHIFREVPADYLAGLAEIVQERTLFPGEVVFKQGEEGDALYLVSEGLIGVSAGGKEVARLGPGECLGELALVDEEPRSATATALEESRLLRISSDDFNNLLPTHPGIAKALMHTLARRLRATLPEAEARLEGG
ncbi:MAG: cyclic nucleotide-binding domain-containing protein [Elusimicrobia bacterium]|nr:cyclic nucleotide-binding domain-containing protein [Elusimicrobiota bacterium]